MHSIAARGLLQDEEREASSTPERLAGATAVVAIHGPIVSRGDFFSTFFGLASYDAIVSTLAEIAADDTISGVVLDIDSPGGDVQGLLDAADAVASLAESKPVIAVASENAFSAAYVLAAAASKIFVSRTAGVGSIGVVAAHVDVSEMDKAQGVKVTFIHAGAKKVDGNPHEALSDRARSTIQAEVDRLHGLLVESVAGHRSSLSEADIRSTEAGTFHGTEAIAAGLADELGTLEDAVLSLQPARETQSPFGARKPWPKRRTG